ncbi:hypothetical protein B7494_g6407 [Chlorociboria aeruginascens]|nr:hypothetical protein B7494_g6407 [Chlorociboria aeruginascens]
MSVVRKIIDKIFLRTINVNGKSINLYAATKTIEWERPTEVAQKIADPLEEAIRKTEFNIPEDTVDIIGRETEHSSDADEKNHFTAVCVDGKNNAETKHFYRK